MEDFHSAVLGEGKCWKTTASFWPRESDLFPGPCVRNLMRNSAWALDRFGPCCFPDTFSWQGSHSMGLAPPRWGSESFIH